jgi:LmbE family N-acetylglucosaminyl deacetylase
MISLLPERIASILCIGAHADDIEIGCGGSILALLAAHNDIAVTWVVLSGNEVRREEARASAKSFIGDNASNRIELHDFRDACFPYSEAQGLKDVFRSLSASVQPDLIFTHHGRDAHQDHRFVNELTWQSFRDNLILEYEIPKYEGDLGKPSVFVPLSKDLARAKIETTLAAFTSQRDKPWFDADTLNAVMRLRGVESKSPTGMAEAFHCNKLVFGL